MKGCMLEASKRNTEEGTETEKVKEDDEDSDYSISDNDDEEDSMEGEKDVEDEFEPAVNNSDKKPVKFRYRFNCSQCNKVFRGPLKFKMHMYNHTGQKPFPCNLCNKSYATKKTLVAHQSVHTGDLPFLCSFCGKRCRSKSALKSHSKCHSDGDGLVSKCDVCDRVFFRKYLMERHKFHKHTNVQTEFKCDECNKVFSYQRSLRRHFRSSHLNIKNHVCELCGKSFYRKEYLANHMIQQHNGNTAETFFVWKPGTSTLIDRPSVSVTPQRKRISEKMEDEIKDEVHEEIQDTAKYEKEELIGERSIPHVKVEEDHSYHQHLEEACI